MGKQSKRSGRAARDIHATIREQAAALAAAPRCGFRDADTVPEVSALLSVARRAIEKAAPSAFEFAGRRYWVRCAFVGLQLDIFDAPGAAVPLIRGASMSTADHGHKPGH